MEAWLDLLAASCYFHNQNYLEVSVTESLRRLRLFASLSDETLAQISRITTRRAYPAGNTILTEGEPCTAAYFIETGEVKIYRLSLQGREQVLLRLSAGDAFNLAPIFRDGAGNHAHAVALTQTQLLEIPANKFKRLCALYSDLSLTLLEDFAARLMRLTDLVESLSLRTVRARLARFLLDQADMDGVTHRWTQDEIATHLGTVRDMIGRALREFNDAGLVRMERQRIILIDRPGLQAESES